MARASLPIETPPLPVPEVLPAPYQAFLVALDRLVDAMDKAVERAPKKAIERLKRAREFGARASIGHDDRARAPYAAPPVRLRGYNGLATAQAPWVDPTDYGPKPDTMTAHAYMARPLHLLDALVAAQAAALDASLALVAAPHLGRATLSVDVAPRTKNGAVRKVGLALGRTPLEPTREHMDKITGDCLWSDVGGARPRLVAYLRAIAAVGTLRGLQELQQVQRRPVRGEFRHGIDEVRLVRHAPGRRAEVTRDAKNIDAIGRPQHRQGRGKARGHVADIAAQPHPGPPQGHAGAPAPGPPRRGRRRRRRRGPASLVVPSSPTSSPSLSPVAAASKDSDNTPGACSCASRQNSRSAASSGATLARSSRKSNAARKRGWAKVRNTRFFCRSAKRGCSIQISCIGSENRRGSAMRWAWWSVTRSAARCWATAGSSPCACNRANSRQYAGHSNTA